jgi:hypothetical protein
MAFAEAVISNVPKSAIVSESGKIEHVTVEHIFDTVFLVDRTVRRVTKLRNGDYAVTCDNPFAVKDALDGKQIGVNKLQVAVYVDTESTARDILTAGLFLLVVWVFFCFLLSFV